MDRHRSAPPQRLSSEPPTPPSERRFFVEPEQELSPGAKLELNEDAAKHARVCRLSVGDPVEVFDGGGRVAPAVITGLWSRLLALEITAPSETLQRGPELALLLCVPRAGKLDDIVRMTAELGVASVHLALSDFSVGTAARADTKLQRLYRVAREAVRQSEGAHVPVLHPPELLKDVLARLPEDAQRVALWARGGEPLRLMRTARSQTWLAVGPEGGFSPRERAQLEERGFVGGSLGPRILRVETAAVVGTALALAQLRGFA